MNHSQALSAQDVDLITLQHELDERHELLDKTAFIDKLQENEDFKAFIKWANEEALNVTDALHSAKDQDRATVNMLRTLTGVGRTAKIIAGARKNCLESIPHIEAKMKELQEDYAVSEEDVA